MNLASLFSPILSSTPRDIAKGVERDNAVANADWEREQSSESATLDGVTGVIDVTGRGDTACRPRRTWSPPPLRRPVPNRVRGAWPR